MTEDATQETTWLTPEAFDRLSKELEHLSGPGRAEIAEKIEAARDEGDLKENSGYHAARDEQGQQEARIRQLEQLLSSAKVGSTDGDGKTVAPGTVVTAKVAGRQMRFLLGNREIAGGSDIDVFSEKSPLGAAVLGVSVGDTASYEAPNGKQIDVEIVDIEPFA